MTVYEQIKARRSNMVIDWGEEIEMDEEYQSSDPYRELGMSQFDFL